MTATEPRSSGAAAGTAGGPAEPNRRPALPAPVAGATRLLFRTLSAVRGDRSFHPDGVAYEASYAPLPGPCRAARRAPLLVGGERTALVRLSRALGLPRGTPDIHGIAIRFPDAHGPGAHQDFLLVTSGDAPLLHHLLLPTRSFFSLSYSSLLPYRIGGEEVRLVGAIPHAVGDDAHDDVDGLARAAARGEARWDLALAPLTGTLEPVGRLTLGRPLEEAEQRDLRFTPWNCGGGLEPAGPFMGLREPAYRGSQEGAPHAD